MEEDVQNRLKTQEFKNLPTTASHGDSGADPGFCEGGFERGFVDSLKGTFEQK